MQVSTCVPMCTHHVDSSSKVFSPNQNIPNLPDLSPPLWVWEMPTYFNSLSYTFVGRKICCKRNYATHFKTKNKRLLDHLVLWIIWAPAPTICRVESWLYFVLPAVLAHLGPFWSAVDEASSGVEGGLGPNQEWRWNVPSQATPP